MKGQGAKIGIWGVGTRLATAYDQPALGGVYKLTAIRSADGQWQDRVKLSEDPIKMTTPGILQVRRFEQDGQAIGDCIVDERTACDRFLTPVDPTDGSHGTIPSDATSDNLLVPIFRNGKSVYDPPLATEAQRRAKQQLALLPDAVRRLTGPEAYPVWLEASVYEKKLDLIEAARRNSS